MIDPDIWQDEKLSKLDYAGRLFFIGLITQSDDYGKLRGNPKLLKSLIFPYEDNHIKIENYIKELATLGIIILYNVNQESFIKIKNWEKYQTLTYKGKDTIPEPPLINPEETLNKPLINPEEQDKLSKEKLNKDKGAKAPDPEVYLFLKNKDFESLWLSWLEVRKQKKVPNTLRAQELALSKLHTWGIGRASEALMQAIESGWRGIYEPKPDPKNKVIYA